MVDFYVEIRALHIVAVIASGALFLCRGLAINWGGGAAAFAMARPLRLVSYGIDTVLLLAALLLMAIIGQYPGADAWLSVKVALLVLYIALGTLALKRGRTPATRRLSFLAALLVYAFIISVARTHDPLGFITFLA